MSDFKVAVPITLALALALSAAAPTAGIAALGDTSGLLKPGSLRNLLNPNEKIGGDSAGVEREKQRLNNRVAQGCWYGQWRRC